MQFIREYQLSDSNICDSLIRCFEECRTLNYVTRGRLGQHKIRLAAFQLSLGRQSELSLPLPLKSTVAVRGLDQGGGW